MLIKASTLSEMLIVVLIMIMVTSYFDFPNQLTINPTADSSYVDRYIHHQFLALKTHQQLNLPKHSSVYTLPAYFNEKGNVNQSFILEHAKSKIHISFTTGRIYESQSEHD